MNKETETTYLENIEECVFDEDKIVTYKWLSKYLGLHANISKQLLYTYAKICSRKNEISSTYFVAGIPKNGQGIKMCVVRESDLESAKESLQKITSEHVYSIQKVPKLKTLNDLYIADKDESFENEDNTKFSSIEFDCIKRDNSFFEQLKAKAAVVVKTEAQATSSVKPKVPQPEDKTKKDAVVAKGTKVSEENTTNKDGGKKVVVPSMFGKATAANKKPSMATIAKANGTQAKPNKQTGMAAFLSKAPPAKSKEENIVQTNIKHEETKEVNSAKGNDKEIHKSDQSKINGRSNEMEVEVLENEKETAVKNGSSKVSIKNNTAAAKGKKKETKIGNKRRKESNNGDSRTKKRRRIMVMDSDSDSSEESAHSEREPTPPPRPSTPPEDDDDVITATPEPTGKHQRRRFVNKSYVDSDGYVVTKKEYIFEDCSDSESDGSEKQTKIKGETKEVKCEPPKNDSLKEEDPESQKEVLDSSPKNKNGVESKRKPRTAKSTKNSKKTSPTKAPSPKKHKQQSITSFFTKKT